MQSFEIKHYKKQNLIELLIATMVLCSLVPDLFNGISVVEIVLLTTCIVCGLLLFKNTKRKQIQPVVYLFVAFVAWGPMCIIHSDITIFLTNYIGPLMFLFCLLIGMRIELTSKETILKYILVLLALAMCTGMLLDFNGWVKENSDVGGNKWEAGVRAVSEIWPAVMTIVFCAPFMFWKRGVKSYLSICLIMIAFWVISIMAQRRGETIVAIAAIMCCAYKRSHSTSLFLALAFLMSIGIIFVIGDNEFTKPIIDGFVELQDVKEITRVHDTKYGLYKIWNSGIKEILFGYPPQQIKYELKQLMDTGGAIHNGYIDVVIRYGWPGAIFYHIFCFILLKKVVQYLLKKNLSSLNWLQVSGAACIVVFLLSEIAASQFWRWRGNVVSGLVIGLWLSETKHIDTIIKHEYEKYKIKSVRKTSKNDPENHMAI